MVSGPQADSVLRWSGVRGAEAAAAPGGRPSCVLAPQVSICLECNSSKLRGLKRKWIRCSAQATVLHLKKFIAKKLNLSSFNEVMAACLCEGCFGGPWVSRAAGCAEFKLAAKISICLACHLVVSEEAAVRTAVGPGSVASGTCR